MPLRETFVSCARQLRTRASAIAPATAASSTTAAATSAAATAAPATAATAASSPTTSAVTASAATTTVPTAPAASVPAATTATAAARLAFARLVHGECASIEGLTVQLGDRRLCILVASELDECEPARLTGHPIGDDADAYDVAAPGGTRIAK
jgi:hypothetical protein